MKFLFAPDSFKGTLSAEQVCAIWEEAAKEVMPQAECRTLPVADGGEGMVKALHSALGGTLVTCRVHNPVGKMVDAQYAVLPDGSAAIEMAAASGLPLLSQQERDPLCTSTFGTGELILHAVRGGAKKIILGLGGSATNDGGMGVGAALGIRYLDGAGAELLPCGGNAGLVETIDLSGVCDALHQVQFCIACDVDAPLCGPTGASHVFGPQKGASPQAVEQLDANLAVLGKKHEDMTGLTLCTRAGMGAAGGMALPLVAFFGAVLRSGLDIVLDAQNFDEQAAWADCIVTGEGCTDYQSAMGKVIAGISKRAKMLGKPVVVLSGALQVEECCTSLRELGVSAMFSSVVSVRPLEWQLSHAEDNLRFSARQVFSLMAAVAR